MKKTLYIILICAMFFQPGLGLFQAQAAQRSEKANQQEQSADLPGWPMPDTPVPYHEPGRLSKANNYTTQVEVVNEQGLPETVQMSGLDAMAIDGIDPLAGNYTLGNLNKILRSSRSSTDTLSVTGQDDGPKTMQQVPDSEVSYGGSEANDVAAGDLNGDYQDEQILAWLDNSNQVILSAYEMVGSVGKTTSAPAAAESAEPGKIDLLVRGYDQALWRCSYDILSNTCTWDRTGAGGFLLSGPAVASKGPGTFDVYAVLSGGSLSNQVYRRSFASGAWSGDWQAIGGDETYWQPLSSATPVPQLPPPAAVEVGGVTYLFRNDASHPLSWWHSDTATWESLENQSLPLMDYSPAVLALDANSLVLLSVNFGGTLMLRKYTISSGQWGNWTLVRDVRKNVQGEQDVTIDSGPLAVPNGSGMDVYVRGSDQQLWKVSCSSSPTNRNDCGTWSALGGDLASDAGGAIAAGQTYLFSQTGAGGLQASGPAQTWQDLGGLPPCCTALATGMTGVNKKLDEIKNFSVDVETGHFWGDGRSQMVLGYFSSASAITLGIYDISDSPQAQGFMPEVIDSTVVDSGFASHFRIAIGDFLDGDGLDDIALLDFHTDQKFYTVHFYKFNTTTRKLEEKKSMVNENPYHNAAYLFSGTLDIASGDFNGDGKDELAMEIGWVNDNFDTYEECWVYDYIFYTFVLEVAAGPGYELTLKEINAGAWNTWKNVNKYLYGLTMATGDMNGDGKDEIIRTWPASYGIYTTKCWLLGSDHTFNRNDQVNLTTQVISLSTNPVNITTLGFVHGPTAVSSLDRIVTGDFDLDLKDEFVWQVTKNTDSQTLIAYNYFTAAYAEVASLPEAIHFDTHLVSGDFTGESLRVGPPSHRVQSGVISPVVLLNMPPKHRDIINGLPIEVGLTNEATYTITTGSEEITSSQSKRDWSLSAGLEVGGGAAGASAQVSLENTYGENFEKSAKSINSFELTQESVADSADKVLYNATDYEVWEYPVYGVTTLSGGPPAILVIFPKPEVVDQDGHPETNRTKEQIGDYCSEGFYAPGHQPYNIWSYDESGLNSYSFSDRDPDMPYYHGATPGGTTTTLNISSQTSLSETNGSNNQIKAGAEVSYENSLDIPMVGEAFEFNMRASVDGSYDQSSLSTMETTLTEGTGVTVKLASVTSANQVSIETFIYWAKGGYLVVDYQTRPGAGSSFWGANGNYYNLPDPAFTLPWYGWLDANNQIEPICAGKQLYTHDIGIEPPYAENGDTVTLSATLRNFSYVAATQPVVVNFYLGAPKTNSTPIASCSILGANLTRAKGQQTCSVPWQVAGAAGKMQIYAVIDPGKTINEVHEENDIIDNNSGYNLLYAAETNYVEPASPTRPKSYHVINYQEAPDLGYGLYVPMSAGENTLRYQLLPAAKLPNWWPMGHPLQVVVSQGGADGELREVTDNPFAQDDPAVLVASYRDSDIHTGMDENSLLIYRWSGDNWLPATCPNYQVTRFPADNTLIVPICEPGTFVLGPATITEHTVMLPVVRR